MHCMRMEHRLWLGEPTGRRWEWECEVSVDSVANALVALMSCSDSELAERGHRARQLAELNYTWEKLARDLHTACQSLVG